MASCHGTQGTKEEFSRVEKREKLLTIGSREKSITLGQLTLAMTGLERNVGLGDRSQKRPPVQVRHELSF